MAQPPTAKPKLAKAKKYILVRYGRMNTLRLFEHNLIHIPRIPARIVVKTDRGLELGCLVGQFGPYKAGRFKLSEEQIKVYFMTPDEDETLIKKYPAKKGRAIVETDTDGSYVLSSTNVEESNKVKMIDKFIDDLRALLPM